MFSRGDSCAGEYAGAEQEVLRYNHTEKQRLCRSPVLLKVLRC